jgi:hypothetical protein
MPKDTVRVPFSFIDAGVVTLSTGTNTQQIALTPAIDLRLAALADVYQLYRFVDLKATLFSPGPAGSSAAESTAVVLAYLNETTDTTPASAVAASRITYSAVNGYHNQVGSESAPTQYTSVPQSFRVPRRYLCKDNAQQWWKTIVSSSVQTWDEQQGTLTLTFDSSGSTSSVVGYCYRLTGVIEFSGAVAATQTPMSKKPETQRQLPPLAKETAKPCNCK